MADLPTRVTSLLETLNRPTLPSFQTLLEALYTQRYAGPVTLHFVDGVPKVVEFTQTTQVKIDKSP